ncbi:hypothetical protein [Novosphingobium sp. CF614]|uniref:hypothetical protein n=1 Tax=Novosphingobium sp. CF614 TaxID=1884364 RepID=UPI001160B785|nr:hypothetical protein [Novosphingobium sp. CF614]
MPNTAYIISGKLTIEERAAGRKVTYRATTLTTLRRMIDDVAAPNERWPSSERSTVFAILGYGEHRRR